MLAADQRVTALARQLRKAGLDGDMDQLPGRAGCWASTPGPWPAARTAARRRRTAAPAIRRPAARARRAADPGAGRAAGRGDPAVAGRVTLTIPAVTLLGLADRPGEMAGLGPIDPGLARDLAAAAARGARSTWCVTVTDGQGHAIGHGCARPAPATRPNADKPGDRRADPPGRPSFTLTPAGQPGPAGGYGTWRFSTGIPGQRDLLLQIGPIPTGECDHRHQAKGHDPGVMLRHLAQVRHATCTGPGSAAGRELRLRAQRPVPGGRQNLYVQREPQMPVRPPAQAGPAVDGRTTPPRRDPVDHTVGTAVRHRTHPLPI